MTKVGRAEYHELRRFLEFFAQRFFQLESMPPENRPMALLERLERLSMSKAFIGIRQAIGDCLEMTSGYSSAQVRELDAELRGMGIVTVSELRIRYSKSYAKILKRGKIRNDTEYCLLRSMLDDGAPRTPEEAELLAKMVFEYEGT